MLLKILNIKFKNQVLKIQKKKINNNINNNNNNNKQ